MAQIDVVDVRLKFAGTLHVYKKALEIAAHQRFIAADDWKESNASEVGVQVGAVSASSVGFQKRFRHVRLLPGQLQVFVKNHAIESSLAAVEHEAVEKHVGFQRIVNRGQLPRKREQPVEVSAQLHWIAPPVLIITGVKLRDVRL